MADREMIHKQMVAWRRDFHKYAESKWREFRTSGMIAEYLESLGIPILLGEELMVRDMGFGVPDMEIRRQEMERAVAQGAKQEYVDKMDGLPGVAGIIDTGKPGPTTALRFDIDSMPFDESTDPDHRPMREGFASVNKGCCHACGHDGHAAIGMAVASWIMEHKDELCGVIKVIFQPAEEGGGGARGIVARGLLDDVQYFFSGHVGLTQLNGIPVESHQLIAGEKDFLDNRRYNIRYTGIAAHPCGDPQKGRNALLAGSAAALGIHSIAPHGKGVFRANVGILQCGISRNTIAPNAYMEVEVRGENDEVAEYGEQRMLQVVQSAAGLYDVSCDIELVGKNISARCDDAAMEIVMECVKQVPWFEECWAEGSLGGTDDASDMMRRVQENGGIGTYIGLGTTFPTSFHDPKFDFDEDVLVPSAELFEEIIKKLH